MFLDKTRDYIIKLISIVIFILMIHFCVKVRFNLFCHPASIVKSITMDSSILGEGCHSEDKIK